MTAPVPRWTLEPVPGTGEYEAPIPDEVVGSLRRLADDLAVPLPSVLVGAHAKVLAALSGEDDLPDTWRGLVLDVHEPGAFDTTGLSVELVERDGLVLRLRYSREVLDADAAARIAGYHLRGLSLMAADPDAEHAPQSLLSPEELEFQLHGLAGPRRELPDARVHELFEERVRAHPDAVAVVRGNRQLTYRQLNERANRLARALRARGLRREGIVAVVTERNFDWAAAVLATFKAGGAYLPIEPHFPSDRIEGMISRAGCGLVLTERGSTGTLDQALDSLPGVRTLFVDAAYEEGHPVEDLGIDVAADQLAYIYFTSGSTGEPKGAMCEHAGMLNHIFAKIDDLGVGEGDVVAQLGPQCFDISMWQLVSALLLGGRTLLVEQEVILDVERFVDRIVNGKVAVLQVVPSYLEALLSYLEKHPRRLPDLRCVSATGEALKKELVQRWFAAQPGVKLANTYGLTETSDDTNHEVMDTVPEGTAVPLGRPVNNVHVYVVDEHLSPVPLGAPGEIVFSGVCVGRGYVNDPERTRGAFMPDPQRAGERLYRSGDYGRWRPDGKLEYLGRRDAQVKISGFRIEIGEVENALLRVPGVRDGAVVVSRERLVAFYTADDPLDAEVLRSRMGQSLPAYMIPSAFRAQERLPLTANGKIDRKALTRLAEEIAVVEQRDDRPVTATERRLAAAWAKVLGVAEDQIGRHDHFFDRGGTSLSVVKLAIALDRAVSIRDVTGHPVLADLADVVDGRPEGRAGLLQPLVAADGAALICFPYAGGNAVNFQALASALRSTGLSVYAVELPGHDLAGDGEPFAPLTEVVGQVVDEIEQRGLGRVLLWGHSSGGAFAVETARRLEERGVDVERVFLGAPTLGDPDARRATLVDVGTQTDRELADRLRTAGGYTELGELEAERAERAGAAFRHDYASATVYLADALESPPAAKLSAPVTVVVAADDPTTAWFHEHEGEWQLLAEHVDAYELADGGHYFLSSRPAEAAKAVSSVLGRTPS